MWIHQTIRKASGTNSFRGDKRATVWNLLPACVMPCQERGRKCVCVSFCFFSACSPSWNGAQVTKPSFQVPLIFFILYLYISPFLWLSHKVTEHHAWVVGTPAYYSVVTLFKWLAFLLIIQLVLCLNGWHGIPAYYSVSTLFKYLFKDWLFWQVPSQESPCLA